MIPPSSHQPLGHSYAARGLVSVAEHLAGFLTTDNSAHGLKRSDALLAPVFFGEMYSRNW